MRAGLKCVKVDSGVQSAMTNGTTMMQALCVHS